LLFEYHPFQCGWIGVGDPPSLDSMVKNGFWIESNRTQNSGQFRKPNYWIPLSVLHPDLINLFIRCFEKGHDQATERPSPEEWCAGLKSAMSEMIVCTKNSNHLYIKNKYVARCFWCDRNQAFARHSSKPESFFDPFPPVGNPAHPSKQQISVPPTPPPKITWPAPNPIAGNIFTPFPPTTSPKITLPPSPPPNPSPSPAPVKPPQPQPQSNSVGKIVALVIVCIGFLSIPVLPGLIDTLKRTVWPETQSTPAAPR
jgi:hypothetical protein